MMKFKAKQLGVALLVGSSLLLSSSLVSAQQQGGAKAAPAKPSGPVICPGYKRGKTALVGQSTGKKVQKAYEAYNEDLLDEAIEILLDIKPKDDFDKAYVNRFVGNIMATIDKRGAEALGLLESSVTTKVLNDTEHASTLKLVGDLSMQEKEYEKAVVYYNKWMDFTCKKDPKIFIRIAQAYSEQKLYAEMIEPADKAIEFADKPDKNAYLLKLSSYFERKMMPEAVKVAEQLVINFPTEKRWWTQLGTFYLSIEDYERAVSTLDIAYQQGYLEKEAQIKLLAQLYSVAGAPSRAARLTEKHLKSGLLTRNESNLATLARSFHQARDFKTAAKYYGEVAKLTSDPTYYEDQGTLLILAQDYKGAIAALTKALESGAEKVGAVHYSLMEANFYANNFRQAYRHAKEARKDPKVRRNANSWMPYIETKAKNRGMKL